MGPGRLAAAYPHTVDPIVAPIISAIVAVSLFYAGQVAQRRTDQDRWRRETDDRRRRDAAPAAKEARKELRAAAALLSDDAGRKRAADVRKADPAALSWSGSRWEPPSDEEIRVHTTHANELAFEIPDAGVAAFLKSAAYVLEEAMTLTDIGAPDPSELARDVEKEVDGVVGAFVHGQPLPDAPKVRMANEALREHWKQLDAYYEEEKQRWLAKRAAKKAKKPETPIEGPGPSSGLGPAS